VVVPVAVVADVAVPVVDVVDVVAVRHGHVPASRPVLVVVRVVYGVPARLALVDVVLVNPVQVAVVDVVHMVAVRHRDMAAPGAVPVLVFRVRMVLSHCGHGGIPLSENRGLVRRYPRAYAGGSTRPAFAQADERLYLGLGHGAVPGPGAADMGARQVRYVERPERSAGAPYRSETDIT
jgi:hypothetical protein